VSARSASTGNLQIASPKSWWCRRYCRWQFVFHRDSTPQSRHWNCKKSGHESTATERGKLGVKEFGKNKRYDSECPVNHRTIAKVQFEIFYIYVVFEHVFINKKLPFQVDYLTATQNRNRVPGQRRLAISRLRVPNLDGSVIATAGNLLSIGTPRHRVDTVFVRS